MEREAICSGSDFWNEPREDSGFLKIIAKKQCLLSICHINSIKTVLTIIFRKEDKALVLFVYVLPRLLSFLKVCGQIICLLYFLLKLSCFLFHID